MDFLQLQLYKIHLKFEIFVSWKINLKNMLKINKNNKIEQST